MCNSKHFITTQPPNMVVAAVIILRHINLSIIADVNDRGPCWPAKMDKRAEQRAELWRRSVHPNSILASHGVSVLRRGSVCRDAWSQYGETVVSGAL
jgi:hypothetical protein